jgi:opacity protein-like surface antigen
MERVVRRDIHLIAAAVLAMIIVAVLPWSAKSQLAVGGASAEAKRVYREVNLFLLNSDCVGPSNQAEYDKLLDELDDIISVLYNMYLSGALRSLEGNLSQADLATLWLDRRELERRRTQLKDLPRCRVIPSHRYRQGYGWEIEGYYASWAGPHVGGGIGVQNTLGNDWTTTEIVSLGHSDFVPDDNGGNFTSGFRVSAYAGYDWLVAPRWLVGIEGEVGYSTNNKTAGIPAVSSAPGDSLSMQEDWDASLRARLGYLVTPQVLVYGTTGAAWQHFSATVTCTSMTPFPCGRFGPVAPMTATNAATPTGWTIGAGLEYMLTGRLKLRAEYRYSDYGTVYATFGTPAELAIGSSIHMQTQTATLGLSYAFGGPSTPASPPPILTKP